MNEFSSIPLNKIQTMLFIKIHFIQAEPISFVWIFKINSEIMIMFIYDFTPVSKDHNDKASRDSSSGEKSGEKRRMSYRLWKLESKIITIEHVGDSKSNSSFNSALVLIFFEGFYNSLHYPTPQFPQEP
jgi:hypothetical protein